MTSMNVRETDLLEVVVDSTLRFEIFDDILKILKWKAIEHQQEWRNKYGIAMILYFLNTWKYQQNKM